MRARHFALAAVCLALAGCGGDQVVTPTAEEVQGTLPTEQPVSGGDTAAGRELFTGQGCNSCHTYGPADSTGTVGPNLDNLAEDAEKADQGSLAEYTAASIKNPDAYVVPGFSAGVMPAYDELSDEQLADLVAFLTQGS
jgi:mono/diheme cytochrome c family protein